MELCNNMLFSPVYAFAMTMQNVYGTGIVPDIIGVGLNQKTENNIDKSFDTFTKSREKIHKSFKEILNEEVIVKQKGRKDTNEMNTGKCNHNPNDATTSLQKINKRIMVQPMSYFFICPCCNQGFRFKRESDGKLIEIKEKF